MRPTPINMAESIIDAFWDPQLSGLKKWEIEPGHDHGLKVYQNWCNVAFEWTRKPSEGPALKMTRQFDIECGDFDTLIVSVMPPEESIFRLRIVTDRGVMSLEFPPAPQIKKEYALPLQGAKGIIFITMEIYATKDGVATGWFNWVGLQNSQLLERYLRQWKRFDSDWELYLKPESYEPKFEMSHELLIDQEDLEQLRREHADFIKKHGKSPFTIKADKARELAPEDMIGEYVNFWNDTRYCRERDHSNLLLNNEPGSSAAIAGLILKDKELLRLAARYAMSIAMCPNWDDGMICNFPGSNFEHRCFVQSLCIFETSLILDWAGEMFTDIGREYIMRRIAEEGQGSINFNTWKHDYIFHCNQLAWFTPGRILGYILLEKYWPRVKTYTDLAYKDLIESLNYAILPDGGYVEGPTYFQCVGKDGGLSLYLYARARGMDFREVIPEIVKKTSTFAEALVSIDEGADVVPICDGNSHCNQESLAVMASLLPDSQWVTMFNKSVVRSGGMPSSVFAWMLGKTIPKESPAIKPFIFLPDMGIMSSVRQLGDEKVKIFIMGNKGGAGHTHEDKGSFVLEFAGETFAMDPGTCDYSSPFSFLLKNCERHNMLVPYGMSERPHPQSPLSEDVKPSGVGDEVQFEATIDATPGWEGYYKKWIRTWQSPSPDTLRIIDEYELERGEGVEFYWNTSLDVEVDEGTIILNGKRGKLMMTIPTGCIVRVETLDSPPGKTHRRIALRKDGLVGSLEVNIQMSIIES